MRGQGTHVYNSLMKKHPWYRDFFKVAAVLFGGGLLGIAVTVGIYMNKVDRLEDLYAISKEVAELKRDVAVLQERTKGSNAPLVMPPPTLRPTAGSQR